MTIEELSDWATANSMILVDRAEHTKLCAIAAASVAATVDFDRDFDPIFRPGN